MAINNITYCDKGKVLQVIAYEVEERKMQYDGLADMELEKQRGDVLALIDCGMMGQWYALIKVGFDFNAKVERMFDTLAEAEKAVR